MVPNTSPLVLFVRAIDRIPMPDPPPQRGRPVRYSDRVFLKILVIMIVRHVPTIHGVLAMLAQPTPEMTQLRQLLAEQGHYPSRRTVERRLARIPATLPGQIVWLGRLLLTSVDPWNETGRAVAIDSTPLRAAGVAWHQRDRKAGRVPHTKIDTEAHWCKSSWHGWVYGWKLHLVATAAQVWIPLAADLTPANVADNLQAVSLLDPLAEEVRFILADTAYQDRKLHEQVAARGQILLASQWGRGRPAPEDDPGREVRKQFHRIRTSTIENFNQQFKTLFDIHRPVPTRGLVATQRWVLGAVLVYQLMLLCRHEQGGDLRVGLKAYLRAA